jgi:DnaK suppressor protein
MDATKKEYFKNLLLRIRSANLKQLKNNEISITSNIKEAAGEHSSYAFHMADMGTDTIEQETSFVLAAMGSELIQEIEHALSKFDNSDYGLCEDCTSPIDEKRLEAIPHARLCLSCKAKNERF